MCENVLIITYFANRRSLIFITWRKDKRRTAPSFSLLHSMLHFLVFLVKNSATPLLRFAESLTKVKTQTVTFASCFAQKNYGIPNTKSAFVPTPSCVQFVARLFPKRCFRGD